MGTPEVARGREDDESFDRTIVEGKSQNSQNEKSELYKTNFGDDSSTYDPETPPVCCDSHRGDMFDDVKELAQHPDEVTEGAELGQQKAEAAALVWGRPALVGIYAW